MCEPLRKSETSCNCGMLSSL